MSLSRTTAPEEVSIPVFVAACVAIDMVEEFLGKTGRCRLHNKGCLFVHSAGRLFVHCFCQRKAVREK